MCDLSDPKPSSWMDAFNNSISSTAGNDISADLAWRLCIPSIYLFISQVLLAYPKRYSVYNPGVTATITRIFRQVRLCWWNRMPCFIQSIQSRPEKIIIKMRFEVELFKLNHSRQGVGQNRAQNMYSFPMDHWLGLSLFYHNLESS